MIYTANNDTLLVAVHHYPVDGVQVTVSIWDEQESSYYEPYDKRVIADSLWESVCCALVESYDLDWEQADSQCAEWGIYAPSDDE